MVNIICIHGAYPISSAIHLLNRPHKFMGNRVVFKHMDVAGMKITGVVVIALIVHRNDLRADKIPNASLVRLIRANSMEGIRLLLRAEADMLTVFSFLSFP